MTSRQWLGVALGMVLIVGGAGLIVLAWSARSPSVSPTPTAVPTHTPEPLIPTRTPTPSLPPPTASVAPTPSPTSAPTATASPTAIPTANPTQQLPVIASPSPLTVPPTATPAAFLVPPEERYRLGVSLPGGAVGGYDLTALGVGWVMDWQVRAAPVVPAGVMYAQSVRFREGQLSPDAATITAVAAARPGSLWLISNEADVKWQDNVTPEVYARLYHEAYAAIKAGDPGAQVAAGGIAEPTPLRLQYLDLVLASYQTQFGESLPAQAWHIHNYMLREERNSWGVDIPPGLPDDQGVLYAIDDSGNVAAFRAQILAFRRWMAERGYRGLPLIVSEFGEPMPEEYGFPPERLASFLRETWQFFLTASDPALGDPTDGGRLVQRWCWFSLGYPDYPAGNLRDPATGAWTEFARVWMSYLGR